MTLRAVIFDLDGVVRDWNDDEMTEVETAFGIEPGAILATGFSSDLGPAVTTGAITYREWMDAVRARIVARYGAGTVGALDAWEANVGRVNAEMLHVVRAVRTHCPAALLSNGTSRLRRDLHALDLYDEFDVIFNSAELGVAKPDPEVFGMVLTGLGMDASRAVFIDDLPENVAGAAAAGLRAHRHLDAAGTVEFLRAQGLPLGPATVAGR